MFTNQPRGLYNFISDIRNSKSKEEEMSRVDKELANIRLKFSATANLTSYDKKKYVWKLCYIYMLGYEVDFGHVEFISLLSSSKYQEKSVGYMAFSMMFRPGDELMTLAVNSMRNDIVGQVHHAQTLALSAVSNMGGNDLAEALAADVQRLIISPLESVHSYNVGVNAEVEFKNKGLLCKKAALCLLRLFRTNPECVVMDEWMKRLAKLLEDRDLGVITSITSLLLGFASNSPAIFEPLVPYVISILTRLVVSRTCSSDYFYYQIPSPWIQVKCLRFLQYYKIPGDHTQVELLTESLNKIFAANELTESSNRMNADHSILFEAISLVISYGADCPESIKDHVRELLGRFVSSRDPNIRYLGIEAMTKLTKLDGPQVAEPHLNAVLDALKDTDISIRKRALTLLYVMTYENNAKEIVGELVSNLTLADTEIKEDLVVKIAILAEKFNNDFRWYIDTMMQVVLIAGSYVADAVWYRIIQIVINTTDIHEYAAEKMLVYAQAKILQSDTTLAIAGYLLGEIGVNICENPGMTGYDQFAALHQHFANASPKVQCLLFTTYVKLLNLYPDQIRDLIIDVFNKYSTSSNVELQQRACEYLTLAGISATTMETVLNTMPPFEIEQKQNILLTTLESDAKTADRSAWSVDQSEKDASRAALNESKGTPSSTSSNIPKSVPVAKVQQAVDLLSLDDFGSASSGGQEGLPADVQAKLPFWWKPAVISRGMNAHLTLLETDKVSLFYGHDYRAHQGRILISVVNNSAYTLQNLEAEIPDLDGLQIKVHVTQTSLNPREEAKVQIAIDSMKPFSGYPELNLGFSLQGASYLYSVKLPVNVSGFSTPLPSDKDVFMGRWKAITGAGMECQQVFASKKPVNPDLLNFIRAELSTKLNFAHIEGLDNEKTYTGSCTFVTGTVGPDGKALSIGVLMRLEGDPSQNKFRVTVRSTHPTISTGVSKLIIDLLS